MAVPTQERCTCGAPLLAWTYRSADGDLLFAGGVEIREGNGVVMKKAALICPTCDRADLMPRNAEA